MKIQANVNLNRIPASYGINSDFLEAQAYHLKHGVEWNYTFVNVNVTGYTSVSVLNSYNEQRWVLNNSQTLVPISPSSQVDMFVFDEAEWHTPTGSPYPLFPNTPTGDTILYNNKPFINIAAYSFDHNEGQLAIQIAHEQMHALVKMANLAGYPVQDVMDTYIINDLTDNPSSNFMTQWGLLSNYLKSMQTYTYFNPTSDPLMVGVSPTLMEIADKARGIAGIPFEITSGLRTVAENEAAGGVSNSAHLSGLALDVAVTDATRQTILKALFNCGSPLFIEDCPSHIHFDIDSSIHTLGWMMVAQNG